VKSPALNVQPTGFDGLASIANFGPRAKASRQASTLNSSVGVNANSSTCAPIMRG
jgi:hypothetical protein